MMPPLKMNGALAQLLSEFRGRDVVVLLNRGNRGDGVIHMGGRQLLSLLGISYREFHETADLSHMQGDVLLIHGAGAMSRGTHSLPRLLKVVAPRFADIVILPSSFDLTEPSVREFAANWDEKYHVFCRELVSFDALRSAGATPKVILLGHDLAFHADLKPWAARPAEGRAGIFRQDKEATYGRLPRDLEVRQDASYGSDREPERLLDFVARFTEIHTDRCHAAITAAMMGRNVSFYRNNYFKNQAIYDHSLAGMPHVHFVRSTPFSLAQFMRVNYWARVRPIEMKVRRVFQGRPAVAQG
jgi:exopolysaccharide biosynthesis predicted pyruvyltransferase EpsI